MRIILTAREAGQSIHKLIIRSMVKHHNTLMVAVLLSAFTACNTCRKLPEAPQANFELSAKVETSILYLEEHDKSKLIIKIEPKSELAESTHYRVVNWSLPAGIRGNILDQNGKAITQGTQLKNGENIFFYEPLKVGQHTLRLEITDQYGDLKKELTLPPITVEEKAKLPFQMELKAERRSIFMHQEAKLMLELTSDLEEASSLAYTVRDVEVSTGSLVLESSGEALTTGSRLVFGTQNLLFQYTGEMGTDATQATIKITASNEQGDLREATVVLKLKPVDFLVNTWLRQPVNEQCNIGDLVLEIVLSGVDKELHDDTWKLTAWNCSDGVSRNLVNSEREELREFPLKCTERNQLYLELPALIRGNSPQMLLTVEGPGKTRGEGVTELLGAQQASVANSIATLLDTVVKANQEADTYLNAPVKGQPYAKLKVAKQATERELTKLQAAVDNIKDSYDIQGGSLPRATEGAFYRIVDQQIPALKRKQEKLEEEDELWDYAISELFGLCQEEVLEDWVDLIYEPDENGDLAIHSCAGDCDEKAMQFLMERTVDIDAKNRDGYTPLQLIIEENRAGLERFIKHGANPNLKYATGKTPLQYALELDQYDHVGQLLEAGADPNTRWSNGETPLLYVVRQNESRSAVGQLLEAGADPNVSMSGGGFSKYYDEIRGWTALHSAAEMGDEEAVRLLLHYGANNTTARIIDSNGHYEDLSAGEAGWYRGSNYKIAKMIDPSRVWGS